MLTGEERYTNATLDELKFDMYLALFLRLMIQISLS